MSHQSETPGAAGTLAWRTAAAIALSAAAQRMDDPETARILESVDPDAWRVTPMIQGFAEVAIHAIRAGIGDRLAGEIRAEFDLSVDPARLPFLCIVLAERWQEFEAAHDSGD